MIDRHPRNREAVPGWDDSGSASLLAALWVSVLALLVGAGVVVTSVLAVHSRVSAAADLGALAGASASLEGEGAACSRADLIVRANGAVLASCRLELTEVWVLARAPAPASVAWFLPGERPHLTSGAHAELVGDDP